MKHPPSWLLLIGAAGLALWSVPGRADEDAAAALTAADEAYTMVDFEVCVENAERALSFAATKEQRTETYQLLGLCQAALANTEAATDAFVMLLAISPDAQLPEGLSPRFTSSFLEAKGQWVGKQAFDVVFESDNIDTSVRRVQIAVTDRPGLLSTVAWRDADGDEGDALSVADKMLLELPAKLAEELVFRDAQAGEVLVVPLPKPEVEEKALQVDSGDPMSGDPGVSSGEASEDEGGSGLWGFIGVGAIAGVVLVAVVAGGALAGVAYATGVIGEPSSVALSSEVAFPE